ncbi:MAG: hypothetical protein EPO40_10400 [Myxococcaceae bacterium]|nr:MAG: hypothetical protein EPO40_10400 [Myxococcaceae bacterium]
MKVVSVTIKNFRSISDATINLGSYSLLVGRNNCGKSNTVDAICAAFDILDWNEARDLPRHVATDSLGQAWVDIEFEAASDEEYADLRESCKLGGRRFKVRNWFRGAAANKKMTCAYERTPSGDVRLSEAAFAEWKQICRPGAVVYIPALSRLEDHMKLTGKAPLNELIRPILVQMTKDDEDAELREAISQLHQAISAVGTHVRTRTQSLAKEISEDLKSWGLSFQFNIRSVDAAELVTGLADHSVEDPECPIAQRAEDFGDGFQRHLVFTLLKIRAKYAAETKSAKEKKPAKPKVAKKGVEERGEFCPAFSLLIFEEPETFLHPDQIDSLHGVLRSISAGDSSQVVVTTHNAHFSSNNIEDLTSFVRMNRVGAQTFVRQITHAQLDAILDDNYGEVAQWKEDAAFYRDKGKGIHNDDLTASMESIKYALWLNPVRCMAFFARRVLLVEGPTEVALFAWMVDTARFGDEMRGVFVMDSMGKFNMHRFMAIFNALGIEHAVLYDDDNGKYRNTVDKTIQDSVGAYTIGVDSFPRDIEDALGITTAPSDKHRKPQHVLYSIRDGRVSKDLLDGLAQKVRTLLKLDVQVDKPRKLELLGGGSQRQDELGNYAHQGILHELRVPRYDLRIAAGGLSASQSPKAVAQVQVTTIHEDEGRLFVARITGRSMEPDVADGSFGLFRRFREIGAVDPRSIDNRRVLVELHEETDDDSGGQYTLKRWRCCVGQNDEIEWVELRSDNPTYTPRRYAGELHGNLKVIAEFLEIVEVRDERVTEYEPQEDSEP